jgi:hypothetical protein
LSSRTTNASEEPRDLQFVRITEIPHLNRKVSNNAETNIVAQQGEQIPRFARDDKMKNYGDKWKTRCQRA